MSYISQTERYLKNVVKKCGYNIDFVSLEPSSRKDLGEFQINICMSLAKKYKKNPRDIAEEIIKEFDDRFINVNIAGPGFINISFNEKYIIDHFNEIINNPNLLIDKMESKKIIIDYGGANVAKALHVGHMRSPNIGEALKRLATVLGHEVIGDVHLGDLGRQSGTVISEIKRRNPNLVYFNKDYKGEYPNFSITTEELGQIYPAGSIAAKENEKIMDEVRNITAEIDKGNEPYFTLWKDIVEVSSKNIKKTYDKLNCTFDLWEGEMSSFKYIKDTLKVLNPYLKESEGAKIIEVKQQEDKLEIPPLIVIKNDGATIYATRDLATIYSRVKNINPDEIWYVVDQRQSLYFEQLFRASYLTGLVKSDVKLYHLGFGTVNGKDGKPYKTRDGGILSLESLIELVKKEINKKMNSNNIEDNKEEIANILTIATIKFSDLLPARTTDYIFDIEKFASFEGKTGPYILYTMVRIKSILKKADISNYKINNIYTNTEKQTYLKLLEMSKILNKAYIDKTLSGICEYLFELCSLFNKFYGEVNILNEENIEKKQSFLTFLNIIHKICEKLLNILAIEIPDKM